MNKVYSDWYKIDLHIHTDKSRKTKNNDYSGDFSVDTLKEKLKANNVEIFSLTDHNIINVEAYETYYKNSNEEDPLLLLGVELDIEGSSKVYHSLIIFNYTTIENAKDISKRLEDKYQLKGIVDMKKRVLTIDEIIEIFPNDDFFFIPHAGNTRSIVEANKYDIEDTQKMVLLMQSAFEKVPEKARQNYNYGFDKVLDQAFKKKDDIAYIEFSDNHNINEYPCKHKGKTGNHEFYYIKGNKSYETLRLAFIDPKSRIKSQINFSKIDKTLNTINSLKIENQTLLSANELFFSPHLNVVIGGRSSGKSLLMYILGVKTDKTTLSEKYKIDETSIVIKSNRDDGYKEKTSIDSEIIYINQGDIVKYFEEKKLSELASKSNKKIEYEESKGTFKEHKKRLSEEIDNLITTYESSHQMGKMKFELHRNTIDSILNKNFIFKFDYDILNDKIDNSEELIQAEELLSDLDQNFIKFQQNQHFEFTETDNLVVKKFSDLIKKKNDLIIEKRKKIDRKINFIKEINDLIKKKNDNLDTEARLKNTANDNLKNLKENIRNHFFKMSNLKNTAKKIESFDYSKQESIEINDEVDLVLEVEKDSEIRDEILDGIKNSEKTISLYLNLIKLLNDEVSIKNYNNNSSYNLKKKIDTQLGDIKDKLDDPKDYLIYSGFETSKQKSPGYNSEKYLEIILNSSQNKMIFIDQPEDNLGNKFISNELVTIIRNTKLQKQIFLVTHNPSIVVYGDAECIILAENKRNKIKYKQLTLENKSSQEEICDVLDGGKYVFDNRSKKYNIQKILREDK